MKRFSLLIGFIVALACSDVFAQGKIEKVGDKLVHLAQLTGAEFFDAAVDAADVSAVVVRTKK
jgi:hypothetical protein